jgi:hypothetical protein
MQNKVYISILGVLILAVLALGVFLYRTHRQVSQLALRIGSLPAGNSAALKANPQAQLDGQIQAEKNKKMFAARVDDIAGGKIIAVVKLMDFSKPKNQDNTKIDLINFPSMYEYMTKQITLNADENTAFESITLDKIAKGDLIEITTDKSPYSSDTLAVLKLSKIKPPG